ncbi:hypothetical protein [Rhodoferax sp.]|uniref:hypothetical protein n=1 Tax=Rhodoferax sp. TaxID=50421 RepID=UPI002767854F|nr:hypothetical protein [Rhodoferax sp.]
MTALLLGAAWPALAQPDDTDALRLADAAPRHVETTKEWQWYAEGALGQTTQRHGGGTTVNQRLSFDVQFDKSLAPHWRAVLANRLDVNWSAPSGQPRSINTLKEAYLSWQARDDRLVDIGRINARYGVATGYNPTDFLRAGAIRSLVSVDPGSLKKNRLGSVMLRGQALWRGGSLTALVSPKLADQASAEPFSPDFGATNAQHRWLLAASQQVTENLNPQWLAYGGQGQATQLGFNLTTLMGDASVAFVEWSGGRSRSQYAQALATPDDTAWRNRLATGLSYTTASKLSLTLEYHHNSAALSKANWSALMRGPPAAYLRYRQWTQRAQELPTQQGLGMYALWQDALLQRLDLNAMLRHNLADRSRLAWLEARYHLDHADLALQWQVQSGKAGSEYGAPAQRRAWRGVVRYYF